MKNIFRIVMAVAILFTASCAKEDISSTIGGGEVEVTFTADLGQLGTRLYGEGDNAKRVYLGVYETGEYIPLELVDYQKGYPVNDGKASITVVLLKDKRYDLVFWAQHYVDNNGDEINDCPVYSRNWSERSISVSYDGVLSQDDTRDAFFLVKNNFHAGHDETTFELRRPFAQLRAAISQKDQDYIARNGSTILTSKVEVKGVADKIELYTENAEVSGDKTVTFDVADIPANEDKFIEVSGAQYQQLSMNYILVREKKLVDVTYTFADDNTDYTRPYYNVPIQRNYRTNILGQLISSPMDFTVIINPEFEVPANDYVTTLEDLQAALNAAQPGLTKIVLGADMKGEVFVHQKADTEIILDGNNHKFDGTIKLHNGSNYSNGKITIENVSFETAAAELNFIMPNEFGVEDGVTRRYSNNVIVRNCSFTATNPEGINGVVGVQAKSCKNLQVIGCVATGLHSLVQAQSCGSDVIVKGSTIKGKNGVAFKQVANAVVEGCTITAAAYGIRFDGNIDNYGITVKDNTVAAVQPLIVRKMTGNNNTITLEGTNTLTTSETFQIVVTNGSDDEAYSYPTGTYTITGHAGFNTYPIDTPEALQAAINNPALSEVNVQGEKAIEQVGTGFEINRDVVLNMNNVELNAGSTASSLWYAIEANGDYTTVINDANFTRAGIFAADGADVVFNSGIIDHKPERTSRYIFCARSGATITINGGTFKNDRAKNAYFWADNSTIYVKGGDFGGVASNNKVVLSNGGQVIISGGTFNFDPTAWLEAGYEVKKVGPKWHVVKAGAGLVTSVDALKTAIADAADGDIIALAAGTYEGLFDLSGKNITIESSEAAVINGLIWMDNCSPVIKGITLSNPNGVQYPNPTDSQYYNSINGQYPLVAAYNNANPRFKNCVFNLVGPTVYGYYGYAHNSPVFEACTFNCNGIRPIANNGDAITVNGCTFNDQYHYSVRIFENQGDAQTVVYKNNTVQGTNTKGEFEGVNISKKGTTAVVLGNFTIEGNTAGLKYRHHKNVTMSDACTYAGDVTAFESEN